MEIADNGLTIAQARVEAGETVAAEADRAAIEQRRARLDLTAAVSVQAQSLELLLAATGHPRLSIQSLEADLEEPLEAPAPEDMVEQSMRSPRFLASLKAVEVSQARLELAREERKPDIDLELAWRRTGDYENALDIGLRVPIPVFDRNQGGVRAAEAGLDLAVAELRGLENTLESEVRETARRLDRLVDRARTLREEVLPPQPVRFEQRGTPVSGGRRLPGGSPAHPQGLDLASNRIPGRDARPHARLGGSSGVFQSELGAAERLSAEKAQASKSFTTWP